MFQQGSLDIVVCQAIFPIVYKTYSSLTCVNISYNSSKNHRTKPLGQLWFQWPSPCIDLKNRVTGEIIIS